MKLNNVFSDSPVCVLLAICNDVIEDKRTNSRTLVGIFNSVTISTVPAIHYRLWLAATITNVYDPLKGSFVISDPDGIEVGRTPFTVPIGNPINSYDINYELYGLQISKAGTYTLSLMSGESILSSRGLEVIVDA